MVEPPDWRLQQTERALNRLERQGFAWEFLRRNPDYRRDYERLRAGQPDRPTAAGPHSSVPPQWGLRFRARSRPHSQRNRNFLAAGICRQRIAP
ncbi:MAG: transcriptional regulator domain-containing protein [Hyphomicrobium sp.]